MIIKLLCNNDYNAVLMMIDSLTKNKYYILYIIDKYNIIAKIITFFLLNNV